MGVEFASVYNAYGVDVTIVELMPRILPNEDEEISRLLERSLTRQGITVMTGARAVGFSRNGPRANLMVERDSGCEGIDCDKVLVAVGVQGNVEGLGLETAGIATEGGFIPIDDAMATGVPGVYAIGDVTGKLLLAHAASAQGVHVVESIAGKQPPTLSYLDMPKATYCSPQVASMGLTEKQANEQGYEVKSRAVPLPGQWQSRGHGRVRGYG